MSMSKNERQAIVTELVDRIAKDKDSFSVSAFSKEFGLTTQSVYRYLNQLVSDNKIKKIKNGKKSIFTFIDKAIYFEKSLDGLAEDSVWRNEIRPFLSEIPQVAYDNLYYAFTEMLNNAIDHSGGTKVKITIEKNIHEVTVFIADNGIGIFKKIADAMGLEEKSFAILELAKGKFTTDPESHTGEGVFFSSKVVDVFGIFSEDLVFLGPTSTTLPYINRSKTFRNGTLVLFSVYNSHQETTKEVFDKFTEAPESYGFTKTIVPVRLLEYGDERPLVVSRSQAKRLMVRFERFENIILDFSGIDEIGQGFADELFRVFPKQHPNSTLTPINCSEEVNQMIIRAKYLAAFDDIKNE